MKTIKSLCGILIVACALQVHAQTITAAEYFFDVDPGVGNGTPISIPSPAVQLTITETISIASLQPGYHLLFVRAQDSNGIWSLFELQEFVIESPIQEVEYFFDLDPGLGNGIPLTIAPGQLSIMDDISIASISDGEHVLFVRTRHEGEWGMFDPVAFYIQTQIIEAEYFIDTDPGFGNGTPIDIPLPNYLVTVSPTIDVGALPNGEHKLFVRTRDILGVWSFFEPVMFTVDDLLPVEMLDFKAELVRDNTVSLNWKTLHEVNSDFFSVQHSVNGSEFLEIGTVRGSGTSTSQREYSLLHQLPAEGINYYRLKQVDFDGKATFSEVVAVTLASKGALIVFPNPAETDWFIEFPQSATLSQWRRFELFDMSGRKCFEFFSEKAQLALSRQGLADGMYFLRVTSDREEMVVKKISFR